MNDLVVIGGGVMGLFTADHASELGAEVLVLERGRIGDPATASYGRTRSFRSDYLDPQYAGLAQEALRLWGEFERRTGTDVLVRCGCMNIAKRSVTPDLERTYAQLSSDVLRRLGSRMESFDEQALRRRFPHLDADLAHLERDAGVVDVPAVTRALAGRARTIEHVEPTAIERDGATIRISTDAGEILTRSLVIAAGHGTNAVLSLLPGGRLQVPITRDRPREAKYLVPPAAVRERFTADAMPVIAYLDAGIYCHPIVDGLVDAVKIGYYNPPDVPRVGVGWRGTGYKFAPWVGRVLAESAVQGGTAYDVARFDPARFAEGSTTDEPVAEDLGTAAR